MVDRIFEDHVKPYIMERFSDADLVLLCGSQARLMNQTCVENTAPKKNSDYDFILLYPELPEKYPAALFASGWIDIPGQDEPVSVDMKIMDYEYLAFHAQHTYEVRRFPFLFNMIKDAYPVVDRHNYLPALRQEADDFLERGPARLGTAQIQEMRTRLAAFSQTLNKTVGRQDCAILAMEGLQMLANHYLRAELKWDSAIDRNLVGLSQECPGVDRTLMQAFNDASRGNMDGYKDFIAAINVKLNRREAENITDSPLLHQDILAYVDPAEKSKSDQQGAKIMTGQYIARLKDAKTLEPARKAEIDSLLWMTLKKYATEQAGQPFRFGLWGAASAESGLQSGVLSRLFSAIKRGDMADASIVADDILANQGGLKFDYLERIYVEDLARRRENAEKGIIIPPRNSFFNHV